MTKFKKDYLALQNLWNVCALRYLGSINRDQRYYIVNDFSDSLIDIKPDGKEAIRSNYERWESDYWIPLCKSKLLNWINNNNFEARIEENKRQEYENIKMDLNYLRYRKIMQLIQDSGIGLGQGSEKEITTTILRGD